MITLDHKTRDAGAYLELAHVAADLRLRGARDIRQRLTINVGVSEHTVKAVINGTCAAVETIVKQFKDEVRKRGFCLHGFLDEDRRGLDSHQHMVVFYLAVDPTV